MVEESRREIEATRDEVWRSVLAAVMGRLTGNRSAPVGPDPACVHAWLEGGLSRVRAAGDEMVAAESKARRESEATCHERTVRARAEERSERDDEWAHAIGRAVYSAFLAEVSPASLAEMPDLSLEPPRQPSAALLETYLRKWMPKSFLAEAARLREAALQDLNTRWRAHVAAAITAARFDLAGHREGEPFRAAVAASEIAPPHNGPALRELMAAAFRGAEHEKTVAERDSPSPPSGIIGCVRDGAVAVVAEHTYDPPEPMPTRQLPQQVLAHQGKIVCCCICGDRHELRLPTSAAAVQAVAAQFVGRHEGCAGRISP